MSSTYFAEGFPYSVVNNLVEILFKELGASLQLIGLTALFHLPWNLKFLWGPFLDEYETAYGRRPEMCVLPVNRDLATVLLHAFADAHPLSPRGVKEALERVKMVPAASGSLSGP